MPLLCWFKIWPGSFENEDELKSTGYLCILDCMGNMRVEHHRSASRCIVAPYFNYPDLQKHFIICCWTFHILPIDLWICKFQYSFCKCLMAWEECVWDDLRKLVESSALVEDRKQVKRAKRRGVSCIHCTVHSQKKTRRISWLALVYELRINDNMVKVCHLYERKYE